MRRLYKQLRNIIAPRPAHSKRYIPRLQFLEERALPSTSPLAAPIIDATARKVSVQFTSPGQTTFTIGQFGSFTVNATGNPTFSEQGALPAGISFDGTTGVISGTPGPSTAGSYKLTLKATSGGTSASQKFTLTVNTAPVITSPNYATFVGDGSTMNFFSVSAVGTPIPTFTESGPLPDGISFTSSGLLSGKTLAVGTYSIKITATNGVGTNAVQNFTLDVLPAAGSVGSALIGGTTQSNTSSPSTSTRALQPTPSPATLDALFSQQAADVGIFVGGP